MITIGPKKIVMEAAYTMLNSLSIDVQIKIRAFGVDSSLEQAGKTPKHYLNVYSDAIS
jgi:hypothetical protein